MSLTQILIGLSTVLALVLILFLWPDPKCPRCLTRRSLPSLKPTPGWRYCCKCGRDWDTWTS